MERTITLRNVCACGIVAALEALVKEVTARLRKHHRPCPNLIVCRIKEPDVPLCISMKDDHVALGIFREPPGPFNIWGDRLLGVSVQLCPACPYQGGENAAGSDACLELQPTASPAPHAPHCHTLSAGQCHGCSGACCGELTVYMTHLPGFPVRPDDVDWFFYQYFNMHDLAAAVVPDNYRFLRHVASLFKAAGAARPGPAAPETPAAPPTPQPAVRGKPGAPPLDCNVWLYKTMCALPDPRAYGHLRPEWQERYLRQMGVAPADWEKSFREAARHYLHRILRERGELHGQVDSQGDDQGEE